MRIRLAFSLLLAVPLAVACGGRLDSFKVTANHSSQTSPPTPVAAADKDIPLDATGEAFQNQIAAELAASHYMEHDCSAVTDWPGWEGLPLKRCRYTSDGQTAEVLMLNPGPRRLTAWLEEACGDLADDFDKCMTETYKNILYQSGGQFPVSGIVIEDMDGNGRGNAYAFRNGVTVKLSLFATGSETPLLDEQIEKALSAVPLYTYTYARPSSTTRDQLNSYAVKSKLPIPVLVQSDDQSNVFNEVVGRLYKEAWFSSSNHVIRAWIAAQGF